LAVDLISGLSLGKPALVVPVTRKEAAIPKDISKQGLIKRSASQSFENDDEVESRSISAEQESATG
jgi:hypothetical protein